MAASVLSATRYRKKPVEVEAVQFTGYNHEEVCNFVGEAASLTGPEILGWIRGIEIITLEGMMHVSPGDWIVKVDGDFIPKSNLYFLATYELVK